MIEHKFNFGDKVFHGSCSWNTTWEQCPDCLGSGIWHVILPNKEEFDVPCGTCCDVWSTNRGKIPKEGYTAKVTRLTIGSIRADTYDKEGPIKYMCRETGIGSGSLWKESDMFHTEEEAMAHAKNEEVRLIEDRDEREEKKKLKEDKKN